METFNELITAYLLIIIIASAIGFVLWLIINISQWIIFQKARQSGWKALIPVYNTFVMLHIIRRPQWWGYLILSISVFQVVLSAMLNDGNNDSTSLQIISSIAALVAFVYSVRITHGLSRSFGHGAGFTLGLLFVPYIFYPMLAFGSSTYRTEQ